MIHDVNANALHPCYANSCTEGAETALKLAFDD
jgi:hypothetical protein